MNYNCTRCEYACDSTGTLYTHIREKHTHSGCILSACFLCEKPFYQEPKYGPKKCQECRELQKQLKTNDLKYGTYVYNNHKRYFIDKGFAVEVCIVDTCRNQNCIIHERTKTCSSCQKIHAETTALCRRCDEQNRESKNKLRNKTIDLKKQLGGACVKCGDATLYKLEFDHINPSKKTKQITRMRPEDWNNEIDNIQLLCGNCHRIKSVQELRENRKSISKHNRTKFMKTNKIKLSIGKCQLCGWKRENKDELCSVLEFDHINDDKLKQVSIIGGIKSRLEEIMKCRLICRSCHQMTTCMQRGGVMLQLQMSENEYKNLYDKYMDKDSNVKMNLQIQKAVKKCYPEFFEDTFYSMEKIGFPEYSMNHRGDIKSNFSGQIKKRTNEYAICLPAKSYYILELYAKMFIPNPNNYKFIQFKDKEKGLALYNVFWTNTVKVPKIVQYSPEDQKLNTFNSTEEAGKFVKIDPTNIFKAITGKQKYAKGFKWRREYIEETNPTIPETLLYKYYSF